MLFCHIMPAGSEAAFRAKNCTFVVWLHHCVILEAQEHTQDCKIIKKPDLTDQRPNQLQK